MGWYMRSAKWKKRQPRILYLVKLSFISGGERNTFPNKQKLGKFITTRPALQEMLTEWRLGGSVSWASDFGSGHDFTVHGPEPHISGGLLKTDLGAPGWLSQLSIRLWLRSWSHSSWVWAPHRALCWQLRAWSPLWILCLPLSLLLPCLCSLSPSKQNKKKKTFKKLKKKI